MKSINLLFRHGSMMLLGLGAAALVMTGCTSTKSKETATHQRGWIGGEYKTVSRFPAELKHKQHSALLITSLNSNTPAALAGLNAGDLILSLNRQKATGLKKFYGTIDETEPGTFLAVKAWHDGEIIERNVRVGRETFSYQGVFSVGLPGYFHAVKLVPHDGFSLCVLGYKPEPNTGRKELSSAEEQYFQRCVPKKYEVIDPGWKAWLVIMQAEGYKTIRSQENVLTQTGSIEAPAQGSNLVSR